MLLELKGLTKQYQPLEVTEPFTVLKGVDLVVEASDALAIVGPSGSGKSTLLNIMGALDRPSSGQILVEGKDLSAFSEKQLAKFRNRRVGFIFQLHHLLPQCTMLENVLVPTLAGKASSDRAAVEQRAVRLLEHVGLSHRLSHRPGELSGGERQRAAVARALINKPKLLLADEPTGSLDEAASQRLADLLLAFNQEEGVALIMVTHALSVAKRMRRILRLEQGKLLEQG